MILIHPISSVNECNECLIELFHRQEVLLRDNERVDFKIRFCASKNELERYRIKRFDYKNGQLVSNQRPIETCESRSKSDESIILSSKCDACSIEINSNEFLLFDNKDLKLQMQFCVLRNELSRYTILTNKFEEKNPTCK